MVFKKLLKEPHITSESVKEIMNEPFPVLSSESELEEISQKLNKDNQAVLIKKVDGGHHILTIQDIIDALK